VQRQPAYDLTLRFNEGVRLQVAVDQLWAHPKLDGPYVESGRGFHAVESAAIFSKEYCELVGFASLADGERLACEVTNGLWPDAPAKVLRVSFAPETVAPRLAEVDEYLADLGRWVFRELPFEVGMVADSLVADWTGEGFWPALPLRRTFGLLWPQFGEDGEIEVAWYPPIRAADSARPC